MQPTRRTCRLWPVPALSVVAAAVLSVGSGGLSEEGPDIAW